MCHTECELRNSRSQSPRLPEDGCMHAGGALISRCLLRRLRPAVALRAWTRLRLWRALPAALFHTGMFTAACATSAPRSACRWSRP